MQDHPWIAIECNTVGIEPDHFMKRSESIQRTAITATAAKYWKRVREVAQAAAHAPNDLEDVPNDRGREQDEWHPSLK